MGELSRESYRPMKFAYADPPYPGQAKRLYGDQPDYAGEVSYPDLIAQLELEYSDGWALSCGARDLQDVLPLCPRPTIHKGGRQKQGTGARVMAWCKPMCPTYPVAVQYAWEPLIVCRGRQGKRTSFGLGAGVALLCVLHAVNVWDDLRG